MDCRRYLKTSLILLILVLVNVSCLKRQNHDISAPEIPYFDITGTIQDADTEENLAGVIVKINVVQLFHEVEFESATDTTDSLGNYLFKAITPGRFKCQVYRDGFMVNEEDLLLQYEPKTFDVSSPKPLATSTFYSRTDYGASKGIHWRFIDQMSRSVIWKKDQHSDTKESYQRIDEGNFTSGFSIKGKKQFVSENPFFHSLAFLEYFWAISDANPSKLIAINSGDGQAITEYSISYSVEDLTSNDQYIFASSGNGHILKFDGHPGKLLQDFQLNDEKFSGIAWGRKALWVAESSKNLLTERDESMNRVSTYRLFYIDTRQNRIVLDDLEYLSFDFYGNLWLANSAGYYFFEFD